MPLLRDGWFNGKNGSDPKKAYNVYKKLKFKEPQLNDKHDCFLITLYDMLVEKNNSVIINGKYDEAILAFCNGVAHRILSNARLPVPPTKAFGLFFFVQFIEEFSCFFDESVNV